MALKPDRLSLPETSIVEAGDHAFPWELRRFVGMLVECEIEAFASEVLAQPDGEAVLATLWASLAMSTCKRELD